LKDTEQSIIEAAILIFNEDLSAPLEKVAEKAQTTRRTLHRYFKDRNELMQKCKTEIRKACHKAMQKAYDSTEDPVKRLEYMFYAGIECGTKDTFLHKLHTLHDHDHRAHDKECAEYDDTFSVWKSHLLYLQKEGLISSMMTVEWMHQLFQGIVGASVSSRNNPQNDLEVIKKLGWFSFSRGIGL
jgi:AcrR family transcriptional regulator